MTSRAKRTIARARAWLVLAATLAAILNGSLALVLGGDEDARDWSEHTAYLEVARDAIRAHGELPFWDPMPCGGLPLLANTQSRVLTPFFLLSLAMPPNTALRLEVLLHSFLGALGAALLAWRLAGGQGRARLAASTLAAFAFAGTTAFTLHVAEGHAWILAGAYAPWALWAFDRAVHARRGWIDACVAGALLALMIGEGGIYPMPHAALAIAIVAAVAAVQRRSARPLVALAVTGVVAVLLAAPKLLPMLAFMARRPRAIVSGEDVGFRLIAEALASRDQAIDRPTRDWQWHEFGSYVGVAPILLAIAALAFRSPRRARRWPLACVAIAFVAIAAGRFAAWAPWALLHDAPVFRSQHVPSRFLFVAVVAIGALAAAGLADAARRWAPARSRALITVGCVALLAGDVLWVGRDAIGVAREHPAPWPADAPRSDAWTTYRGPPCRYLLEGCRGGDPRRGLAEATRHHVALIDAYEPSCPREDTRWNFGRVAGLAGADDRGYRGEAWIAEGSGAVAIVARTTRSTTVDVRADAPSTIVLDQNGDEGWSADVGELGIDARERLVWRVPATSGVERHVLRYTPPRFGVGLACFGAGVALCLALGLRRRSHDRAAKEERGHREGERDRDRDERDLREPRQAPRE